MTLILAIDTAASLCAACVYDAGAELGRSVRDIGKGHAEQLMGVIEEALGKAGVGYPDLGAIAVSVGPGSFTGVRVGVAAARGFALALKIPAIGVNTLEALAAEARAMAGPQPVLATLDAKRDEIYAALYAVDGSVLHAPAALSLEAAAALASARPVLAGTTARSIAERIGASFQIGPETATADIRFFAALAAAKPFSGEKPKPLYLRGPDVRPQGGFALPRSA